MRRGTVALPSLSCLALRPPVVPTGVGLNKRQKTPEAAARSQVISYLNQLTEIVINLEDWEEWKRRFLEAARNLFVDRYPSEQVQEWLFWESTKGFAARPVPKSDAEQGEMADQWDATYTLLQELEGQIDAMRRSRNLLGLREKPKNKKQKTATPAQAQRVNQAQAQRDRTRDTDRESGDQYFNTPAGRQGGPNFVQPGKLDGDPGQMLLSEELKRKWPDGLKERLVARRDPDGRCCAADPDQ